MATVMLPNQSANTQAVAIVGPDGQQLGSGVNPFVTSRSPLPAGTNRSGTITTGGTAQQLAAANTSRQSLVGQNISSADLWISETITPAVIGAAGSYRVQAGQSFTVATNRAISIVGATTGQAFTATET